MLINQPRLNTGISRAIAMKNTDKPTPDALKHVRCPTCGGDSIFAPVNPFRPFCSARCKNMDLGAWASEGFRMPTDDLSDDSLPRTPQ